MDLETAIQQILRGEFYLEMESDEQYEMLIDACQEMGVSTTMSKSRVLRLRFVSSKENSRGGCCGR